MHPYTHIDIYTPIHTHVKRYKTWPRSRSAASNYLKEAGDAHGTVKIQISIGKLVITKASLFAG